MNIINDLGRKYNLFPLVSQGDYYPPAVINAEGVFLFDDKGKEYIDLSSQFVNVNLGHGNKRIISAAEKQLETLPYIGSKFASAPVSELASVISCEAAPEMKGKVFFTLGGADANENALKIAKSYTGRYKIFSSYSSYHGSTYGAGNLTGESRRFSTEPGIPGFIKFFYPEYFREKDYFPDERIYSQYCIKKLEDQIINENPGTIAALFIETVIGSNGVIVPPEGYLKGVRDLCTKYGIVMVCDEVMTGFFRTGSWFAYQQFNIVPDIISFAKGVTCSYLPLGGVLVSGKIAEHFNSNPFPCTLTNGAHPVSCAAGLAAVKEYKRLEIENKVKKTAPLMADKLKKLKEKYISAGPVRSMGLLGVLELVKDRNNTPINSGAEVPSKIMTDIMNMFYKYGLSTYHTRNMISVSPPLIITEEELDEAFVRIEKVLQETDSKYCV